MEQRVEEDVRRLREMLESELDRSLANQFGCWPLLVAAAGVLLGVALLVGLF